MKSYNNKISYQQQVSLIEVAVVEAFVVYSLKNLEKNHFANCHTYYFDYVKSLANLLIQHHHYYHRHPHKKVAYYEISSQVLNNHSNKIYISIETTDFNNFLLLSLLFTHTLSSIIVSSSEKSVDPSSCERFQSILTLSNNVFCLCRA